MILTKVISGAQTGADIAGLKAAKEVGIETGGMMPMNFYTERGHKPQYSTLYGVIESYSKGYQHRTEQNILNSDGTVVFANNFASPGTKMTLGLCKKLNKPVLSVNTNKVNKNTNKTIVRWLLDNHISILNVAGNRESKAPGIERLVEAMLIDVFKTLLEINHAIKPR